MGHSSQAIFPRFLLILALESLASSGNIFALTKDQFTPQVEVEMDSHFFGNRPTSCWSPHCQCHTHAFPNCCSLPPLSLSLSLFPFNSPILLPPQSSMWVGESRDRGVGIHFTLCCLPPSFHNAALFRLGDLNVHFASPLKPKSSSKVVTHK